MKILYRYISIKTVKYFFILLGIFSLIIISSQLLHLPSIVYYAGFIKFIQILIFVNLSFFKYQILFGFFIASLLTGLNLRENREIYAIYSSGITKNQLLFPVFSISVLFTLLALVFSLFIIPYANRERAIIITENVKKHILDSIVEKNFIKISEDLTIYVNQKKGDILKNVFIHNRKKGITITAKKAVLSQNSLVLENGYIQISGKEGFNLLKFKKYSFIVDVKYMKKYEFEDLDNKTLFSLLNSNSRNKAIAVLSDRFFFGIPFMFIGLIGFLIGIQLTKNRDSLVSIVIVISIVYLIINTYMVKMIQKGVLSPIVYGAFLLVYFGGLALYFYRKK